MVLTMSTPLCPAGHLPLKGGDGLENRSRLALQPIATTRISVYQPAFGADQSLSKAPTSVISPLEGEMVGRPEGGQSNKGMPI